MRLKMSWSLMGLLFLVGCTDARVEPSLDRARELENQGRFAESAEQYARLGETQLTAEGFLEAKKSFDQALRVDRTNALANLYSVLVDSIVALEGAAHRMKILLDDKENAEFVGLLHELLEGVPPTAALYQHLMTPSPNARPFRDWSKLQDFISSKLIPLGKVAERKLAIASRAGSLTLQVPDQKGGLITVNMDRLDLGALLGAVKYQTASFQWQTAYTLKGLGSIIQQLKGTGPRPANFANPSKPTPEEIVNLLRSHRDFLTLNANNELDEVNRRIEEILTVALDLANGGLAPCRSEARAAEKRLFIGLCIPARAAEDLGWGLRALRGPEPLEMRELRWVTERYPTQWCYDADTGEFVECAWDTFRYRAPVGPKFTTVIDLSTMTHSPVRDLKSLLPTGFTRGGQIRFVPDATFNGLFPRGDGVRVLNNTQFFGNLDVLLFPY